MTDGPLGRRSTILVVDDSEVVLDVTRVALENAGHVVVTRARPEGTIAAILQEKPDLVLLDVNMPRMSGEMIASVLATAAPARETILLLHSSLSGELLKLKVLQTGAHGYIQKTGNVLDLVNQVGAWLKRPGTFPSEYEHDGDPAVPAADERERAARDGGERSHPSFSADGAVRRS